MRRQNIPPGSIVAIQGLGGLGHLAIQYANKFGYRVVALSRSADKEKFARELGAHEYIDGSKVDQGEALQKLGGAAMIVVTATSAKTIPPLIKGLSMLGKLLILARKFSSHIPFCIVKKEKAVTELLLAVGEVTIDTMSMTQKGLSVLCWPSGHALDSGKLKLIFLCRSRS